MAISINVIESARQIVAGIPEYININISGVANAIVYYTTDGSTPDPDSLTTLIMEHLVGDPLNGVIFLPTNTNLLYLNVLAVGVNPSDIATFYRRYGLDSRNIGIGRPGIKKPVDGGSGYINTINKNISESGQVIATDGYTEGSAEKYTVTQDGYDGYVYNYYVATSGEQVAFPEPLYDHIYGYADGDNPDGYSTTSLTAEQEQGLVVLSGTVNTFVAIPDSNSSTGSKMVFKPKSVSIDPRSSSIKDSSGDEGEVIPVEDYPAGYVQDINARNITNNFEDAEPTPVVAFTSGGIFDPTAQYMLIDGRVDGYINGQPVLPGDRVIINKPYGELRYPKRKGDLGEAIRKTNGYISGGLVTPIYDYEKGQAAFYYWDSHDNRWVVSLQKIEAPKYEIFAKRNGVVVGQVFKWIVGKGQMLPG